MPQLVLQLLRMILSVFAFRNVLGDADDADDFSVGIEQWRFGRKDDAPTQRGIEELLVNLGLLALDNPLVV